MLGYREDFARRLLRWYRRTRRDLPWRVDPTHLPDPYLVLVSEFMLQQTQVATVVPYFRRFIARFPKLSDLSGAQEQDVLRVWQGLGYYSRARHLLALARKVVQQHAGKIPISVDELLKLPGIGRYTAGAIASIAFGQPVPAVDGNVMRVLCRMDMVRTDPREPVTNRWLWHRAQQLLPGRRVGDFNSAMMELGATVCLPRNPKCVKCPAHQHCEARMAGVEADLPAPRRRRPVPLVRRRTYCIRRGDRFLLEQRPATGRWASMWQFITVPPSMNGRARLPVPTGGVRPLGRINHSLTHRRYEFEVYLVAARKSGAIGPDGTRRWLTLDELQNYPLPRPQLRIAQMLASVL